ncbi:twin-arginine translocase TatA/TatE family subunit [Microbacterium betulae]|uniref:Sec-independent protein translocase protein TatA n=1 Tax=Microbacterium betulae TaxID=2981139 RepID=A0AA97FKB5_9MICO|nr:twin-arginine translocase TatA/TatE family subunit [Microbacterium sp. AB]WOF24491.1 twin-arginine translocase TatA/TatE family subunit [Microbacterium sp. AB]
MLGNLNGWHLLILLAVILLLFGAARLPALAKSVGQSARVFRGEMKQMQEESSEDEAKKPAADTGYTLNGETIDKPKADGSTGSSPQA